MKRCAISVLTAAILMAWEPGVLPFSIKTPPAAQEGQAQSSLADPVDRDRIFCGWENLLLLFEGDPQAGPLRRGSPGRPPWYCALGLVSIFLFRFLSDKHRRLFIKACCMPYRMRMLPLGSHAPPVPAAA